MSVVIEEAVGTGGLEQARAAEAFIASPAPLVLVSGAGRILLRNDADRREFADAGSLMDRFCDPRLAARALRASLDGDEFCHEADLFVAGAARPQAIAYRRVLDPKTGEAAVLCQFEAAGCGDGIGADRQRRARLAHDLRAPLNAIQGFAELLQRLEGNVTAAERAAYLDDIRTACAAMLTLVENIIADGAGPLDRFDLSEMAEEIARLHTPRAAAAGRRIAVDGADTLVEVRGGKAATRRILENLVDNALRHGGGGVEILVEQDALTVCDEGGPRRDRKENGRVGGLGLGICRELAEEMGAIFEIEASPAEGYLARLIFPPVD